MSKKKTKKKHTGLILLILVLVLVVAAGAAYYFIERRKPQLAAADFMKSVQELDFDSMSAMIQSEDLSILDGTDVRNEAYTEFFRKMCSKMTYKIIKTQFDLANGTANVTLRISYIDGSEIYKEASSEFLRQIAAVSFSGETLSEEELNQTLADILVTASESAEDHFLITDISYPMISINGEWKVVSLDAETIKVMSANFSTVEEEFNESMDAAQDQSQVSMEAAIQEDDVIDMSTDRFSIHYTQFRIVNDISGNSCLLVYYDYTNKDSSSSSPMIDVSLQAYQNDVALEAAIPETTETALDFYMSEVAPQQTVNVCQAFSLNDSSDVTLKANDAFAFGGGDTTSQILKIQ
jgi:flagellar basal body-associated protein FliL